MPEETVGYVRLEWTCERCGTINPGPQKKCQGCGAPQPEEQDFELPPQQELITDEEELKKAKAGPDIHCAYCGARNPGNAEVCVQCGAPLTEGTARKAGKVLGAAQTEAVPDVACPFCGAMNPGNAKKCNSCGGSLTRAPSRRSAPAAAAASAPVSSGAAKKGMSIFLILGVVLACLIVVGGIVFLSQTTEQTGVVKEVNWEQAIAIEELGPVTYDGWRDEVPSGARLGSCQEKYRYTTDEPVAGAKKVCGTSYVKDEGSGYGKVVQECEYEVYDDWCEYIVDEWRVVRTARATGSDLNPVWPALSLGYGQREGERSVTYKCVFLSNDQTYTYSTTDPTIFGKCVPGSKWKLSINKLGALTGIEQ